MTMTGDNDQPDVSGKPAARAAVAELVEAGLLDGLMAKVDAAPTYKGGFGFGPMLCFADATGEALAARLRPGNAAANNAADHLAVLDDAISQLPATVVAGHRVGDPPQTSPGRWWCGPTRRAPRPGS